MEELQRLHKDVPFGWLLWVQELFGQRARKEAVRAQARVGRAAVAGGLPDDLHCLSGPH